MERTFDFVDRARSKHGDQFDYAASRFAGSTKPIEITCRDHGPFQTTPKSHLHTTSGGCPRCLIRLLQSRLRSTTERFVTRSRKVHGDRYRYDQVEYRGQDQHVTIKCPQHGPFQMRPYRHLAGRGCKKCAFQRIGKTRRLPFWEFIDRVVATHGVEQYEYELRDFVNMHSRIRIYCLVHGPFRQSVNSHLRGTGCPKCIQSRGEQSVRESLRAMGIEFREQVRFKHCRAKRPLPFDFYVPSHRLLIEFDGRQHYENSALWGGDDKLAETQRHDAIKDAFAKRHGFDLLRIPHWELDCIEARLHKSLAAAGHLKEEIIDAASSLRT